MNAWIPLMDYAMKKGVSLSTLRRHIKANKVQYRIENGRYLLLDNEVGESSLRERSRTHEEATRLSTVVRQAASPAANPGQRESRWVSSPTEAPEVQQLQAKLRMTLLELQQAQKEIVELKTLIAFYEESGSESRN